MASLKVSSTLMGALLHAKASTASASFLAVQRRSMSILTGSLVRPTLTTPRISSEGQPSKALQWQAPALPLQQTRGAKRNTFNPSHVIRKRRHGFLTRNKTKSGRKLLTRRRLKKRSTLSH